MNNRYFSLRAFSTSPDSYALGDPDKPIYLTLKANGERDLRRDLQNALSAGNVFEVSIVPGDGGEVVIIIDAHTITIPVIGEFLRKAIGVPTDVSDHTITHNRRLVLYWYNPRTLITESDHAS